MQHRISQLIFAAALIAATLSHAPTAQAQSAPALPAVDQLHEALNKITAQQGSPLRMEFSGCMKDDRYSDAVTCYYRLAKTLPVEAKSDGPKRPLKSIYVELPGGKQNSDGIPTVAFLFAQLLVPTLSMADMQAFKKGIADDMSLPLPSGGKKLRSFLFDYQTTDKKNTLKIYSEAN